MISQNSNFFENFKRNFKNFLKIPQFLAFLSKTNPYKESKISETDGRVLDKQWVVWYREATVWAIDVHINGLLLAFVLSVFNFHPFAYSYIVAEGVTIWLVPKVLSLIITPFIDGAREIVRDLPRK